MSLNGASSDTASTPSTPAPKPRRQISVTLLVVAVILTAAIAIGATGAYFELRPASTPGSVHVIDDVGRSVNVPYNPGRVVVLGANIMDPMFRLGLRGHVVGVDCYTPAFGGLTADYSSDQIQLWNLSQSMCVQVGPTFAYESLLNLTPNLVLASTIISVADVEQITATYGIPVVVLQANSLGGIETDVSIIGEIFGVTTPATTLNGQLSAELYNASEVVQNALSYPTVLVTYSTDSNGYWTFGFGSFGESLITAAGGVSIAANTSLLYPELSPEQVLAADPQWVVYGTGFGLTLASYQTAPDWSSIPAVAAGNITGLDSNYLTEADPSMILDGLPALIAIFHPGLA